MKKSESKGYHAGDGRNGAVLAEGLSLLERLANVGEAQLVLQLSGANCL
ncbi:MAG: hypothetical protein DDT30_01959 [Dehalococcoidia bacterium]|nr:hypothetical protein [Bacillota bacterium]MBT9143771.1 hypothetical protein [Bacillota bacterium]